MERGTVKVTCRDKAKNSPAFLLGEKEKKLQPVPEDRTHLLVRRTA